MDATCSSGSQKGEDYKFPTSQKLSPWSSFIVSIRARIAAVKMRRPLSVTTNKGEDFIFVRISYNI
jgi:hypothetical protein